MNKRQAKKKHRLEATKKQLRFWAYVFTNKKNPVEDEVFQIWRAKSEKNERRC